MSAPLKPQNPVWSEKDLRIFIAKRQDVMLEAGYPLPEGLLGKNTDSEYTPQFADREMLNYLSQKAERAWDLWVGDAFDLAVKAIGGDSGSEHQVEALKQVLREAPFDFDHPEGVEDEMTQGTESSASIGERDNEKAEGKVSSSVAALSQP